MLIAAQLREVELQSKLIDCWYDPKYKYYFSGCGYKLTLQDNNDLRHDLVYIDKDDKVAGYLSYQIDHCSRSLYNFGLIGFAKNNTPFIRECIRHLLNQKAHRCEFWAWADNPANKIYQRLINRYNGTQAGRLHNSGYFDGKYHDSIIYEILFKEED